MIDTISLMHTRRAFSPLFESSTNALTTSMISWHEHVMSLACSTAQTDTASLCVFSSGNILIHVTLIGLKYHGVLQDFMGAPKAMWEINIYYKEDRGYLSLHLLFVARLVRSWNWNGLLLKFIMRHQGGWDRRSFHFSGHLTIVILMSITVLKLSWHSISFLAT